MMNLGNYSNGENGRWHFGNLIDDSAKREILEFKARLEYSSEANELFPIPLINGEIPLEQRRFNDEQRGRRRELWKNKYLPRLSINI